MGSLDAAVNSYLAQDSHPLWRLLDPVVSSLPDQGVEQPETKPHGGGEKKRKAEPGKEESKSSEEDKKEKATKKMPGLPQEAPSLVPAHAGDT